MGGLTRLFMRILPIITLICFICFGISYTFENQQTGSITYLSKEVITLNDNGTQETTDDLTIEQYKFNMVDYVENIDQDILKRSTTNVIDSDAYTETLNNFNAIWENGYDPLDIIRTLGNSTLLVVNTIIAIINIVITPLRIISGLLLTGFSIIGINVNKQTTIIKSLNAILDMAAIPYIHPIFNNDPESINNTTWLFNDTMQFEWNSAQTLSRYTFNFTIPQSTATYTGIRCSTNFLETQNTIEYFYLDENNQEQSLYVYNNGWIYQNCKEITILEQNLSQNDYESLMVLLDGWATRL